MGYASDSDGSAKSDIGPYAAGGTKAGVHGNETAWFDDADYAGKATASDAPRYFPGITPGQTAVAAGIMAGLPAAAIIGPVVGPPLAGAAIGVVPYIPRIGQFVNGYLTPGPPSAGGWPAGLGSGAGYFFGPK